jgi:hypothetical protein
MTATKLLVKSSAMRPRSPGLARYAIIGPGMVRMSGRPEAEKPERSRITIGLDDLGQDVVTIPPVDIGLFGLPGVIFLMFWLCGWAGGVAWAFWVLAYHSASAVVYLFMLVWLGIWLPFGYFAYRALVGAVHGMFGTEQIVFDSTYVVHTRRLFGSTRRRRYPIRRIARFEWQSHNRRLLTGAGCSMLMGERRIPVAYGVGGSEAAWLLGQLNDMLGRKR